MGFAAQVFIAFVEFPVRTPGTGRRDPNDGMGFVSGVAWAVILFQETHEFVAIEPRPARVQVDEEFKFAAREDRHEEWTSLANQA